MSLDIERRLVAGGKVIIQASLPADYKILDYQEVDQFDKNNFKGKNKRWGWSSGVASNSEDTAPLQFRALNHQFNLILMTDYNNKDDDTAQEEAKSILNELILAIIAQMRKTKVSGVREVSNVVIGEIDPPTFLDDNSALAYVTTVIINYRYRI